MKHLSSERVAEKLRELHGNLAAVGRCFGVTRSAVYNYIRRRPSLQAICEEARETLKDNAESVLYRSVLAGESWAVCFFLRTQARDRGYVERQEMTGEAGGPIKHVVETVVRSRAEAKDLLAALADQNERFRGNGHSDH
jgi:predicted transcriptional regulator